MEINTRPNMLRILLAVFITISFLIIGINYFILDKILLKSAEKSLSLVARNMSGRISSYLQPLIYRANLSASLINHEVVIPSNTPIFIDYLHSVIADTTAINAAYFADTNGNFYLLKKQGNQFLSSVILRNNNKSNILENTFDLKMNLIGSKPIIAINYDPRTKLWYQEATTKKSLAWYIFSMTHDIKDKTPSWGEASILPLYDKSGNLSGVFGIDVHLNSLGNFLQNLEVYPNSIVLINDNSGRVMAIYAAKNALTHSNHILTMEELHMAWINEAFTQYQHNQKSPLIFTHNQHRYIAIFAPITDLQTERNWYVTIVTPLTDIVTTTKLNIFLTLLVAFGVFLIIFITKYTSTVKD